MIKTLSCIIKEHVIRNIAIYLIIVLSFTVGITTGVYTVNELSKSQNDELIGYIKNFLNVVDTSSISNSELLKISIFNNLKNTVVLWFLGVTVIGISIIPIVIGIKGFAIGFTIGFLIKSFSF